MSEQAERTVQLVLEKILRARRRITAAELVSGVILFLAIVLTLWFLLASVEAGLWLSVSVRSILSWLAIVLLGGLAGWFILRPILSHLGVAGTPGREEVARRIGHVHPEVSDRLVNMLQLADGRHSAASTDLVSAAVTSLGETVAPVDFNDVEDFGRPRRWARFLLIPVVLVGVMLVAAPGPFLSASQRLASPGVSFVKPDAFALAVTPGDTRVVRGSSIVVSVAADGVRIPETVTFERLAENEERVEAEIVEADSLGVFATEWENIRKSFRYRINASSVVSPWYTVDVVDRPAVERLQLSLDYPRYAALPRQRLDPGVGDVTALRGTRVGIELAVGGADIALARIVHDDGRVDTLDTEGERRRASGAFRVRRDGTYHVSLQSVDGVNNESPIRYRVRTVSDAIPTISFVSPQETFELEDEPRVVVVTSISDDFGFNRMALSYRLAESRFGDVTETTSDVAIPLGDPRLLTQEVAFEWNVAASGYTPVPGDVFEYFVTVWDNDSYSGYKPATTRVQRLIVPSLAEKLEQLNEKEDEVQQSLEELMERASEVQSEFEELKDQLRQDPTADWEDERQLDRLQQKQEELESTVDDLTEQMREVSEQMREQGAVSEETMQLFEEFQNVMEEINSDELQDALESLREAMDNMDLQQLQEALNEFSFQEEQFRERLERSVDLMKELRVRQGLDEVAKMAEELAEKQKELGERTEDVQADQESGAETEESTADQREDIAAEQELSAEDMKALEERMQELAEQMQEVGRAPNEGMQQMAEEAKQEDLSGQMQENAEQMRENELSQARQNQQQMQQQLEGMQQQMGQMQQGMQGAQMQMDMEGLRRALADVLMLSDREEALRGLVDLAGGDGPRLRELARDQVELSDGLRVVTDSLRHLARRIPQMSSALQELAAEGLRDMASATSSMSDRVPAQAAGHQRSAMMQLNELALLLSDLLNSMNNPSGGGGSSMEEMMQQMQQMAGNQQQLNEQIQQMLNDMAGQRLTQDMQERMRALAGQQDQMRRQLKEMSRNPELRGKALGDLNKIAQQMEETVRELERRRAGRRTVERQQEILTRLLEATRSMQERGKENKRESRTGEESPRTSPDQLPASDRLDALRRDLIRALDAGYAPDYEELIKRYFEELQNAAETPR